ncbi:MAG: hypothetical protein ACJATA_001982, partial [Sphingobacteriales bacterium]
QTFTNPMGDEYRVELLKMYLSDMYLFTANGDSAMIKDVALLDFETSHGEGGSGSISIYGKVPNGDYNLLKMGLGLNKERNAIKPSEFSQGHPQALLMQTYWEWLNSYRFIMVDGRVDTIPGAQSYLKPFSYHTGLDTLYRTTTVDLNSLVIKDNNISTAFIKFDLNRVFGNGAQPMDLKTEGSYHGESDLKIGIKVSDNFSESFTRLN